MALRAYITEPCPLSGYDDCHVRICAGVTYREWQRWREASLGAPDCAACLPLQQEGQSRVYCADCAAARAAFGESIVLFYGPELLGYDVATPEQALALFDRDDALPSEVVTWLFLAPRIVRERREKDLVGNLSGS